MALLIWASVGVVVGWLAGLLMKGRDYGFSGNLLLGILGGLVGGWLFHLLGFAPPTDLWRQAIVSLLGAMVVLGVARRLKPVTRHTRKVLGEVGSVTDIEAQIAKLGSFERGVVARFLGRSSQQQSPNAEFDEKMTFGQRVADKVATFGGSWTFIGIFLTFMLIWMLLNSETNAHWDPYPFILLNLVLSCLAAMQAPVIMMSQNRQNQKDRLMAEHDYAVNLRSEIEIGKLHARFDDLRDQDWQKLVEMQQQQIRLLQDIIGELKGQPRGER